MSKITSDKVDCLIDQLGVSLKEYKKHKEAR